MSSNIFKKVLFGFVGFQMASTGALAAGVGENRDNVGCPTSSTALTAQGVEQTATSENGGGQKAYQTEQAPPVKKENN